MRKKSNIKKWIVGVVFMLTTFVGICQEARIVQIDCVKRVHRYEAAPSITTIYPCGYLRYSDSMDLYAYDISIIVDSVYINTKTYRMYVTANGFFDDPELELRTDKEELFRFQPIYINNARDYFEVTIPSEVIPKIRSGEITLVTVHHKWTRADYLNPPIRCGDFLKDFIAKY